MAPLWVGRGRVSAPRREHLRGLLVVGVAAALLLPVRAVAAAAAATAIGESWERIGCDPVVRGARPVVLACVDGILMRKSGSSSSDHICTDKALVEFHWSGGGGGWGFWIDQSDRCRISQSPVVVSLPGGRTTVTDVRSFSSLADSPLIARVD